MESLVDAIFSGSPVNMVTRDALAKQASIKAGPIPAQHVAKATQHPVIKKPQAKNRPVQKLTEPAPQSLSAREDKKKVCKSRPDRLAPRRAGGGASKDWVPWCK